MKMGTRINTPYPATEARHTMKDTNTMTARFNGLNRQLPEGREWRVTSERSGNTYVVTVWQDADFGRMARCSCKAGQCGVSCRHVRFIAHTDSYLTGAPVREIRPVYERRAA